MFPARADIAPATVIRRIAHGAFWSLLGTAASRLFTVASSILVARILGREGFGGYGIVQSTIAMFAVLADLALGATATKYVADYRIREPERASRILGFSVTVALVSASLAGLSLLALSSWLASESLYAPELASALRIGALLLFVSALNGVLRGALAGFEAFRAIARINFIQAVATPLLSVPLATYLGVDGAMAAQVLVVALGAALARVSLSRLCRETNIPITLFSRPRMEEYSVFVRFSLPAILAGLLVLPVTWYCSALLARQPNGLGELGLFNAANQWRQVVLMVPQVLGMVMLPVFSEVYGRADKGGFERVVLLNLRVTWCVALPAAALVTALQHPLAMLFGKQDRGHSTDHRRVGRLLLLLFDQQRCGHRTRRGGTDVDWAALQHCVGWRASHRQHSACAPVRRDGTRDCVSALLPAAFALADDIRGHDARTNECATAARTFAGNGSRAACRDRCVPHGSPLVASWCLGNRNNVHPADCVAPTVASDDEGG